MKIETINNKLLISDTVFSDFSKMKFEMLQNQYQTDTIVLHGDSLEEDIESIKENFKDEYFVQLGYTADSESITQFESKKEKQSLIRTIYPNEKEALEDVRNTYEVEIDKTWYKYIPDSIHKENIDYLTNNLDISRVYSLKSADNNIVSIIMTFDSKFFTGELVDQIGWVWIDQNLSKEIRTEAHLLLSIWLRSNLRHDFYQAGIHIENTRSQKFFTKLGFKAKCAHITKR